MKVYDNTLRLVHGRGVEGKIWLTGCLRKMCLVVNSPLQVKMVVRTPCNRTIRTRSIYILPNFRPFPVDGLLELNWINWIVMDVFVEVWIKIGMDKFRLMRGKALTRTDGHVLRTSFCEESCSKIFLLKVFY